MIDDLDMLLDLAEQEWSVGEIGGRISHSEAYEECLASIEKSSFDLEKYRELEKELGIDLLTLFKALKDGIFVPTHREPTHIYVELSFVDKFSLVDYDSYTVVEIKDYGKTWALTKEELE